jgi:hypothetical protein
MKRRRNQDPLKESLKDVVRRLTDLEDACGGKFTIEALVATGLDFVLLKDTKYRRDTSETSRCYHEGSFTRRGLLLRFHRTNDRVSICTSAREPHLYLWVVREVLFLTSPAT